MKNFNHPPVRHPAASILLLSLCCFLSSFLCIQNVQAQLVGNYTIGGADGDYATFSQAVAAMEEEGVSGPVTFKVRPGTYQEQLNISGSYEQLTFEGEQKDSTAVVLQYSEGSVINIYSSNVALRHLTISGIADTIIGIYPGAASFRLENNIIQGAAESILLYSLSSENLHNNHHQYLNNLFTGGKTGILKLHRKDYQKPDKRDEGLRIMGNILDNQRRWGIRMNGQAQTFIENNKITVAGHQGTNGIFLNHCGPNTQIGGNDLWVNSGGNPLGTMGIYASPAALPLEIKNNRVELPEGGRAIHIPSAEFLSEGGLKIMVTNNIVSVKGTSESSGISLAGSAEQHVYFNTIQIFGQAPESKSIALGLSADNIHLVNNIASNTASGWVIHQQKDGIGFFTTSDYNAFFTNGENFAHWKNSNVEILSMWQAWTEQDTHSLFEDPQFQSADTLIPTNIFLDGTGISLEAVSTDFFGKTRTSPPDVGAVEFEVVPDEPLAGTYTISGSDGQFANFAQAVKALQLRGISGPVTFKVRPGIYEEQIDIGFPGSSCINTVSFEGEASDREQVILQAPNLHSSYTIKVRRWVEGVQFRNMTIKGSQTLVEAEEGTNCFSLENNILMGESGVLVRAFSKVNEKPNHHHQYQNNLFMGGSTGLVKVKEQAYNAAPDLEEGLLVIGNEFKGQSSCGISMGSQTAYQINHNRIEAGSCGIAAAGSKGGKEVNGNTIQLAEGEWAVYFIGGAPKSFMRNQIYANIYEYGGSALYIEGTYDGSDGVMLIANNLIKASYNHSFNDFGWSGMNLISTNANIYHNSIQLSPSYNDKGSVADWSYGTYRVFNNNFSNLSGKSVVSPSAVAMDYNNLYSPEFDLEEWQNRTGFDKHSISVRPDEHMLHPALAGAGIYLEQVNTDFFGKLRSNPPDIGAVEFDAEPVPEPTTGFITGGGWFHSPAGAYEPDPLVTGRAIFGFHARHKEGEEAAEGNVTFLLPDARLVFHSRSIDWLSVDENQAFIKGSGRIGREEGYHFLISVVDHGQGIRTQSDHLRMIIWDAEENIVYDNQRGDSRYAEANRPIQRGNITIHGQKGKSKPVFGRMQETETSAELLQSFRAYPTQLNQQGLWLEFPSREEAEKLQLSIYDMQGRRMTSKTFKPKEQEGKQLWRLGSRDWSPGVYLLKVEGHQLNHQQKLIK